MHESMMTILGKERHQGYPKTQAIGIESRKESQNMEMTRRFFIFAVSANAPVAACCCAKNAANVEQ
jgi:hypothetical protein